MTVKNTSNEVVNVRWIDKNGMLQEGGVLKAGQEKEWSTPTWYGQSWFFSTANLPFAIFQNVGGAQNEKISLLVSADFYIFKTV